MLDTRTKLGDHFGWVEIDAEKWSGSKRVPSWRYMRVQETCFLTIHPRLNRIDFEESADRHDCHPKCGISAMGRKYGQ